MPPALATTQLAKEAKTLILQLLLPLLLPFLLPLILALLLPLMLPLTLPLTLPLAVRSCQRPRGPLHRDDRSGGFP